jgi:hypothetical protein
MRITEPTLKIPVVPIQFLPDVPKNPTVSQDRVTNEVRIVRLEAIMKELAELRSK